FGDFHGVLGPPVVETRLDLDLEGHGAPRYPQVAHDLVPVGWLAFDHGHEVQDLANAVRGHEPGDQHRGVREIQLLGHVAVAYWRDPEIPALLFVQQRAEHTRRVEPRTAEEVDGAVGAHQRGGLQVTDKSVLTDIRIASGRSLRGHLLPPVLVRVSSAPPLIPRPVPSPLPCVPPPTITRRG